MYVSFSDFNFSNAVPGSHSIEALSRQKGKFTRCTFVGTVKSRHDVDVKTPAHSSLVQTRYVAS